MTDPTEAAPDTELSPPPESQPVAGGRDDDEPAQGEGSEDSQ